MNEETVKLWCIKADNDLKAGKDEFATERPATDTVCFHMQQCAEKYLKAFLTQVRQNFQNVPFPFKFRHFFKKVFTTKFVL